MRSDKDNTREDTNRDLKGRKHRWRSSKALERPRKIKPKQEGEQPRGTVISLQRPRKVQEAVAPGASESGNKSEAIKSKVAESCVGSNESPMSPHHEQPGYSISCTMKDDKDSLKNE